MSGDLFPFNLTDNAWGIHEIIHNDSVIAIEATIVHLPTGHVLALFREEADTESARRQTVFELLRNISRQFEPRHYVARDLIKVHLCGILK